MIFGPIRARMATVYPEVEVVGTYSPPFRPEFTQADNAAMIEAVNAAGADGTATFILGGQISGARPEIFLVYPEGNYIRASNTRPFLQIGETKYGKAWLDLAVHSGADMITAAKVAPAPTMAKST